MNVLLPDAVPAQRLPFATGADRLRLLYRLPIAQPSDRVLVIGSRDEAQEVYPPDRPLLQIWDPTLHGAAAPVADASFDVVALPGSVRPLGQATHGRGAPFSPQDRLAVALRALKPGGRLVGHMEPTLAAASLKAVARQPTLLPAWVRSWPWGTALRCRHALSVAGFADVECYHVEPRIGAPTALIASHPAAARRHFTRATFRNRALYSRGGFLARLGVAWLGLGGLLQAQVYFLARKPC